MDQFADVVEGDDVRSFCDHPLWSLIKSSWQVLIGPINIDLRILLAILPKYWKFFFNFILEICLTNAFLIFCRTPGNNDKYDLLDFRLDIANQLINNFSCRKRKIPTENPVGGPLHEQVRSDRPKSTCKWCPKFGEKKRKETVKGCSLCNVHLCSINCFDRYHQN